MYRIGIDLGGTKIAAGVVDEAHRIVGTAAAPTAAAQDPARLLDDVAVCVSAALSDAGVTPAQCAGAGLGAPGSCDPVRGLVRFAPNLGWKNVPARELLAQRLGLPVFLGNDADCAALGEAAAGAAAGCGSALLITLGTGVGGGFVVGNRIFSGRDGLGGEFGHMCVALEGAPCGCGRRGCWEAYASATALAKQARAAAAACPDSLLNRCGRLDGRAVYAAAAAGDAAAMAVTARYGAYVGLGLVNLINLLAPETVLLGGGIAGAGEALFSPVRTYVAANAFVRDPALLPPILPAALGAAAGVVGAAALVSGEW